MNATIDRVVLILRLRCSGVNSLFISPILFSILQRNFRFVNIFADFVAKRSAGVIEYPYVKKVL